MLRSLYKNIYKVSCALALMAVVFGVGQVAHAASLSLSPASSKVTTGNIVSLRVMVGAGGVSINNAEGTIQFPTDLLDVVSVSKNSSVLTLWVEEPKFSNYAGTITFNGGVPNPGYSGASGEVFTVVFRAKKTGTASIVFADTAVRQNDGFGTNVLMFSSPASIEINPGEVVPIVPAVPDGAPLAPVVTSTTHPQSNKWYSNSNVELQWKVPSDVTEIATAVTSSASSVPTGTANPFSEKKINSLNDGVSYFHIRYKNKQGWGPITHFRIQIDTVAPNPFKVTFPQTTDTEDPSPVVSFKTTDAMSGVDRYEMKVDNGPYKKVTPKKGSTNLYSLFDLEPGERSLLIKAVDMAGNETVQTASIVITSINPPRIDDYPSEINEDELLKVGGSSYPKASVEVVVENEAGYTVSQIANTNADGRFTTTWAKRLSMGSYTIKARAIDNRDAKSSYTKPLTFVVKQSSLSVAGTLIINWLSLIFIIILALGAIILLVLYFIYKIRRMKNLIGKKVRTTETSVHRAFDTLRDEVRQQLKLLEKTRGVRELTKEEERIIEVLQSNLVKSEENLEKQLSDIEKTVS